MKTPRERDLSAEVDAFMARLKGCNASELVEILKGMIAKINENSYFYPDEKEEEGAADINE